MTKPITHGGGKPSPDAAPKALEAAPQAPGLEKRRPSKSRMAAWAKIDGGKGTWKPK